MARKLIQVCHEANRPFSPLSVEFVLFTEHGAGSWAPPGQVYVDGAPLHNRIRRSQSITNAALSVSTLCFENHV